MTRRTAVVLLVIGLVAVATPAVAQAQGGASAPSDAQVRDLEKQIESLQQQLDKLKGSADPAARRSMMEQNSQGMQDYMGRMHERWGMGEPWMMMGSSHDGRRLQLVPSRRHDSGAVPAADARAHGPNA